jgi:hypothetical protein
MIHNDPDRFFMCQTRAPGNLYSPIGIYQVVRAMRISIYDHLGSGLFSQSYYVAIGDIMP